MTNRLESVQTATVTCSCGKTTHLAKLPGQPWTAFAPGWTSTKEGGGWTCGQPGHRQAGYKPDPPTKLMTEGI